VLYYLFPVWEYFRNVFVFRGWWSSECFTLVNGELFLAGNSHLWGTLWPDVNIGNSHVDYSPSSIIFLLGNTTTSRKELTMSEAITANMLDEMKATLDAKRQELAAMASEVEALELELAEKAESFLSDIGVSRSVSSKPKATKATRKTGGRWQAKGVLRLIHKHEPVDHATLTKLLKEEKPDASLANLGGYLELYTTNKPEGLKLNAAGKKLLG
jgi:hypothetical protein